MTDFSPEQIQQDRETIAAAWPGPWFYQQCSDRPDKHAVFGPSGLPNSIAVVVCSPWDRPGEPANMESIAASHNRWPLYVAEVERLDATISAIRTVLAEFNSEECNTFSELRRQASKALCRIELILRETP